MCASIFLLSSCQKSEQQSQARNTEQKRNNAIANDTAANVQAQEENTKGLIGDESANTNPANNEKIVELKYFEKLFQTSKVKTALLEKEFAVDGNQGFFEFFQLYENNRYRPIQLEESEAQGEAEVIYRKFIKAIPSVVTPDVVLHNLHLFFDYLLATAEQEVFILKLQEILTVLITQTKEQYLATANTPFAIAAGDNLIFLSVGNALLQTANLSKSATDA